MACLMNRPAAALSIPSFPVAPHQRAVRYRKGWDHTFLIRVFRMLDLVKVLTDAVLEIECVC